MKWSALALLMLLAAAICLALPDAATEAGSGRPPAPDAAATQPERSQDAFAETKSEPAPMQSTTQTAGQPAWRQGPEAKTEEEPAPVQAPMAETKDETGPAQVPVAETKDKAVPDPSRLWSRKTRPYRLPSRMRRWKTKLLRFSFRWRRR